MTVPTAPESTAPYAAGTESQDVPFSSHVQRAEQNFEAARAALYRTDGQPVYSPTEHNARLGDLLAEFDQSVGSCIAVQERHAQEAETALQAVQRDPIKRLDTIEGLKATNLQAFVKEDFESLPLAELVEHCRGAMARNSAAEMALCQRYGRRRIEGEKAQYPALVVGGDGAPTINTASNPNAAHLPPCVRPGAERDRGENHAPRSREERSSAAAGQGGTECPAARGRHHPGRHRRLPRQATRRYARPLQPLAQT
jgi:hypothetical protein